jgi:tetratricopeptide (TPR) repeat protein
LTRGEAQHAREFASNALSHTTQLYGETHTQAVYPLLLLCEACARLTDVPAAQCYLESAEMIVLGTPGLPESDPLHLAFLLAVGSLKLAQGDFEDSLATFARLRGLIEELQAGERTAPPASVAHATMLLPRVYAAEGAALSALGRPSKALSRLKTCLGLYGQASEPPTTGRVSSRSLDIAMVHCHIGAAHMSTLCFSEALAAFDVALPVLEAGGSATAYELSTLHLNLGLSLLGIAAAGDPEPAEHVQAGIAALQRARVIRERMHSGLHPTLAPVHIGLARAYLQAGFLSQAQTHADKAWSILQACGDAVDAERTAALQLLNGDILASSDDWAAALTCYSTASQIMRAATKPGQAPSASERADTLAASADLSRRLSPLGRMSPRPHSSASRLVAAGAPASPALLAAARRGGPKAPEANRSGASRPLHHQHSTLRAADAACAHALLALGRPKDATAVLERLIGRSGQLPAVSGLRVASGLCHWQAGELQRALSEVQGAVGVLEQEFGPNHPHVATARLALAALLFAAGRPSQALQQLAHARAVREARDPHGRETIRVLFMTGQCLEAMGPESLDRALATYTTAKDLSEAALGADHPQSAQLRRAIAGVLRKRAAKSRP